MILVDAPLSVLPESFNRRRSCAIITRAPKFYLFDVGVAGNLAGRRILRKAGPEFGRALEHLILMELLAYRTNGECNFRVAFWRTKSGLECHFVLGKDGSVGIEVKGSTRLRRKNLDGIRAFVNEHRPKLALVVCNESTPRRTAEDIWDLVGAEFFACPWSDRIIQQQ